MKIKKIVSISPPTSFANFFKEAESEAVSLTPLQHDLIMLDGDAFSQAVHEDITCCCLFSSKKKRNHQLEIVRTIVRIDRWLELLAKETRNEAILTASLWLTEHYLINHHADSALDSLLHEVQAMIKKYEITYEKNALLQLIDFCDKSNHVHIPTFLKPAITDALGQQLFSPP